MGKLSKLIIISLLLLALLSGIGCGRSTKIVTRITLSASPAVLNPAKGRYAHISGFLRGDQQRIPGVSIILEQKTGGTWTRLTTVTTNLNGVYFYRFAPAASADYRAKFIGNATYSSCTSKAQRIDIAVH